MAYTEIESEHILEKFDRIIRAQNRSIYSLSNDSGVSYGAIHKWRKSKSMPTLAVLSNLCRVLNVSVASLLSPDDDPIEIDESEKELLALWSGIDSDAKNAMISLLKSLQKCR